MDKAIEVNFDGIIGPTHNYGGLSYGNVASLDNKKMMSSPRDAALEGLEKMNFLASKGVVQAVLPPQERPFIPVLRSLGFSGAPKEILSIVAKENPELLAAVSSAACMWTANAATISPSADSVDGKVHITPANLSSKFHRAIEVETTSKILKNIFHDTNLFIHHEPLISGTYFADEGAANHTRFCHFHGAKGIQLFAYGKEAFQGNHIATKRYPARQTLEASQAISRLHNIPPEQVLFAQQNPEAIDAGVFHNDVISVGNENMFFYHEKAFLDQENLIRTIEEKVSTHCKTTMRFIEVKEKDISLSDAVSSYLFNSQLITLPNQKVILVAPIECEENERIKRYLEGVNKSIDDVYYFNLRQSMRNGGGPACLRLRVVLTPQELATINQKVIFNDDLYKSLKEWIHKHYRDRLSPQDLADPKLLDEVYNALNELTHLLDLGPMYHFQQYLA